MRAFMVRFLCNCIISGLNVFKWLLEISFGSQSRISTKSCQHSIRILWDIFNVFTFLQIPWAVGYVSLDFLLRRLEPISGKSAPRQSMTLFRFLFFEPWSTYRKDVDSCVDAEHFFLVPGRRSTNSRADVFTSKLQNKIIFWVIGLISSSANQETYMEMLPAWPDGFALFTNCSSQPLVGGSSPIVSTGRSACSPKMPLG